MAAQLHSLFKSVLFLQLLKNFLTKICVQIPTKTFLMDAVVNSFLVHQNIITSKNTEVR